MKIYVIAESDGDSWGPPKRAYLTKKQAAQMEDGYVRVVAVDLICPRWVKKKKPRRRQR